MNTPNLNPSKFRFLAMMMLLPFMASVSYSQTVIYRETFGDSSGQVSLASQGITDWTEIQTMTGISTAGKNSLYPAASMGSTGTTTNVGLATGTANEYYQNAFGVYRMQPQWTASESAQSVYTSVLNLEPATSTYTIQWHQSSAATGDSTSASGGSTRVLVKVGDSWYVSSVSFTTSAGEPKLESLTYDPTASNWLLLSKGATPANPDVTNDNGDFLLTSKASSKLSGNITAVGLLILNSAFNPGGCGILSFDNFSVLALVNK